MALHNERSKSVEKIPGYANHMHLLTGDILEYHRWRSHRILAMDTSERRPVQPPLISRQVWHRCLSS